MKLNLTNAQSDRLHKNKEDFVKPSRRDSVRSYGTQEIDLNWLTDAGLEDLTEDMTPHQKKIVRAYIAFLETPEDKKIGTLQNAPTAFRALLAKTEHRWVFRTGSDGQLLAWHLQEVNYHPPRDMQAAYVSVRFVAYAGEGTVSESFTIDSRDISGKSAYDILFEREYILESDALFEDYQRQIERYNELYAQVGTMCLGEGLGFVKREDRWRYMTEKATALEIEGLKTRMVLDTTNPELKEFSGYGSWDKRRRWSLRYWDDFDEEGEETEIPVTLYPVHPYLNAFDLRRHEWIRLHVNNVIDYEWNTRLADSLILPEDDKRLVNLLTKATGRKLDDIIAGKSSGIIVLASGPPGVGKTATAEVTAEALEKPLYSVQCSQLGTTEDKVEEKLSAILTRASRWGAILLIDEADVYVRHRGDDIQQNAIVGVFLRTLEYYRGFLFLTTNQATEIDDAILSRCTAHVKYVLPEETRLSQIIEVQAKTLDVQLDKKTKDHMLKNYLGMSGRDVRSVMKLAKLVVESDGSKKGITPEDIDFCMRYQDYEHGDA